MQKGFRKIILAALLASMVYNIVSDSTVAEAAFDLETSAKSAIVMSADGRTVFEKNADERRLIASTTKLMTALVAIELSRGDEVITVAPECCGIEGTSMYLRPGQSLTVDELLQGLLLASGNDAAEALAVGLCGSEAAFVERMNAKAAELGLDHTAFANPHGLDAEEYGSTARDLARLMLACMEQERFARLSALRSCQVGENYYVNHNKLLEQLEGCIGGKTGYTRAAGRCLVSCCERDGMRFVCVTLSDPDDWNDHIRLYEAAFAAWERRRVVSVDEAFEIPLVMGQEDCAIASPERELTLALPRDEVPELVRELPLFAFAPVRKGEYAGRIVVLCDGEAVDEIPLLYNKTILQAKE